MAEAAGKQRQLQAFHEVQVHPEVGEVEVHRRAAVVPVNDRLLAVLLPDGGRVLYPVHAVVKVECVAARIQEARKIT